MHPSDESDQECTDDQEWNFELCQCVSTVTCELACESPLLLDPIDGCSCISLTEYLDLYDHGLDEHCKPVDDCADCKRNINVFNFYAPVYGDVSGFADGHVSNINAPDCDDDITEDIIGDEAEGDDQEDQIEDDGEEDQVEGDEEGDQAE